MSEDFRRRLNREFWNFLRSQGFPRMTDETLMKETSKVESQAAFGRRMKIRRWRYADGGMHSDDVALTRILAESLGPKEGTEWDWTLESDNYHFTIMYSGYPRVRKLLRMLDLYRDADMVRLQVLTRLRGTTEVSEEELQRIFMEEWRRLREEEEKRNQLLLNQLKAAFEDTVRRVREKLAENMEKNTV